MYPAGMFITHIFEFLSRQRSKSSSSDYLALVPIFNMTPSVPRNLFQICIQEDAYELPAEIRKAINSLREMNNRWNYHIFDDSQASSFILAKYGEGVLSYYKRINPHYGAARADFLRYLLLYYYGGVYIDLKCGLERSLDKSVGTSSAFPVFFWDNMPDGNHHPAISMEIKEGEILQGFIVSPAGHPFIREVIIEVMKRIDQYNPYVDGVGYGGTMKITGPGMYTETIYHCMKTHPESCYVAKPFADFGFILRVVKAGLLPGMTDYRRQTDPLVSSGCRILDSVNGRYLGLLAKIRRTR